MENKPSKIYQRSHHLKKLLFYKNIIFLKEKQMFQLICLESQVKQNRLQYDFILYFY
jgi:hypothetical protein